MPQLAPPIPLHLRILPESGNLPKGWLKALRERFEAGPEGFVALDRELPPGFGAPVVLGWGRDRREARLAAAVRSRGGPETLLVHPCTAALREAVRAKPATCFVFDDVAYAETEPTPDTAIEDWLDRGAYEAHGNMAAGGIGEWDEMMTLIAEIAHAYLKGHPSVEISEDGRFGWTSAALVRGEAGDDGVAPLSSDVARANGEIEANLRRRIRLM